MQQKCDRTEEDIKRLYITPAIERKWDRHMMTMETCLTDGKVNIKGNKVTRRKPKKADYVLYMSDHTPIAVVEAKDNKHSPSYGMQQALEYARMLDVSFAYSSNGDCFVEHDLLTGQERERALDDFPTEAELITRFRGARNISEAQVHVMAQPYYSAAGLYPPRYYQCTAINRTVDAVARGQNRILLVMATGTGKTYTAFQIVWRLLRSGLKKKILYLADRNILVDQSIQQDFAPLEKVTHKINVATEKQAELSSYQVYFALYQQLVGDDNREHYSELFTPDYFDLVIVDECHRGSAKEESRWRRILEYFSGATQIGMTATPKETRYQSSLSYFGEPLFRYSLNQGIEDGFLAPFRVIVPTLNISEGWRPVRGQLDKDGVPIPDRIYSNSDFDYSIVLEDRTREVAERITAFLKRTDRMARTIVFCADEEAAERMRVALVNANADMVRENTDYVVRITGNDDYGKRKLSYFISASAPYPVIATTSKLLSTGVDCKMVKLIVLDQMINSMTEFKQIIGRGTRLRYDEGKTHFTVMDLRGVSRLFADPDWDGPVEVDPDFEKGGGGTLPPIDPPGGVNPPPPPAEPKPIVTRDGCSVRVINERISVYDTNGDLLLQEDYIDYTREKVLGHYATLSEFINGWSEEEKKATIRRKLESDYGIDLAQLKAEQGLDAVDDFDFICHVAYDRKPLTRRERAENVKKRDFFAKYSGPARAVLEALLDRFTERGIYEMEDSNTLHIPPFLQMGKPSRIVSYFGGNAAYKSAVRELEQAIYE